VFVIGPIRHHQLIGFAPKDLQVSTSQEGRIMFEQFFIGNRIAMVEAAIYGNVDCVDYISLFRLGLSSMVSSFRDSFIDSSQTPVSLKYRAANQQLLICGVVTWVPERFVLWTTPRNIQLLRAYQQQKPHSHHQ
jgi:hypothetical protein